MSTQSCAGHPAAFTSGSRPRAEVVCSLLRPPELVAARKRAEAGEMVPPEFKAIEDGAVDDALRLQEDAGIDVITDGEMRRWAFFGHLIDALEGFDRVGGWAIPFRDETGEELVLRRQVVARAVAVPARRKTSRRVSIGISLAFHSAQRQPLHHPALEHEKHQHWGQRAHDG